MARVDMSVTSEMTPQEAWERAADLEGFGQWLTIFNGWRSEVPAVIEKGTKVSSCIKVKGFRNIIHWDVTAYDPPECIELCGKGRGGIRIALNVTISKKDAGSRFRLCADLYGGVLNGPVGRLVARVIKNDVQQSVTNLANLQRA